MILKKSFLTIVVLLSAVGMPSMAGGATAGPAARGDTGGGEPGPALRVTPDNESGRPVGIRHRSSATRRLEALVSPGCIAAQRAEHPGSQHLEGPGRRRRGRQRSD